MLHSIKSSVTAWTGGILYIGQAQKLKKKFYLQNVKKIVNYKTNRNLGDNQNVSLNSRL
jgi:hypothetical protein